MPYKDSRRQSEYQRTWLRRRRREWLDDHGPCVRCGSTENLEVDHISRRSKIAHRVWSWSKRRRDRELSKCQVLCKPCHLEKSRAELSKPLRHGTLHGYNHRGCRCDACRQANRERYNRVRPEIKRRSRSATQNRQVRSSGETTSTVLTQRTQSHWGPAASCGPLACQARVAEARGDSITGAQIASRTGRIDHNHVTSGLRP